MSWAKFCGFLLKKVMGWTVDGEPIPEKKAIVLGAPHTSAWDFVVSYLFYVQFGTGVLPHVMIKKEFFVGPVGWFLRKCGCVPVDRSNASSMVFSLIHEMEKEERFILAIAPEGTRKPTKRWKTGYHLIAKQTGVPVYVGYFDWGTKHVGVGEKFELSDDARGDTEKIQERYRNMGLQGKHPKDYIA